MKYTKKALALFLALCMMVTSLPLSANATETTDAAADTALSAALADAKYYIDELTINNSSNDPETVVKNFKTHFSWDNEKRENSKSYLFDWSYYNGVVFEGLEYVYEVTGEDVYKDYVVEYMSSLIASDGTWATCTNNSSKQCAGYDSTHGADCYKTASLLLDTNEMTGDSRYLTIAETLYADLDTAAKSYSLSNAGNNYRHTWASDSTPDLWLDGLYMILPFRAEYAKHIGDTEELDLIVDRMQWVSDNMYNSTKKLFYHAADSASSNSGTYWLRSIGWYAAAIVDIMDSMEGENLEAMKAQLVKLVDGMKASQNSSNGMWLNNMAASQSSTNPYETSGTALVCYAVMKAVNEGWLDESYADMAILAFKGICEEKLDGKNLTDICFKGAPGSSNSTFYDNEGKGVGPFIMFYAEVLKYVNGADSDDGSDDGSGDDSGESTEPEPPSLSTQSVVVDGTTITVANISNAETLKGTTVTDSDKALIEALIAEKNYTGYVAYDLSAILVDDTAATVSIPVPADWNADKLIGISVENGVVNELEGTLENGVYSFDVNHFSAKGVAYEAAPAADDETTTSVSDSDTGNLVGGTVYTLDTDGVTTNKNYLIVNTGSDGTGYALTNNGSNTPGSTRVTITDKKITVEDDTNIAWVFSGRTSGTVKNGTRYVYLGNGSVLSTSTRTLTISNQNNGAYRIYRSSPYYLRYYNGSWSRNSSASNVYLYEYTSSGSGEAVTFTISSTTDTVLVGNTLDITSKITLGNGTAVTSRDITWQTSDSTVATVEKNGTGNGTVTAVSKGEVTITATLNSVNGTTLVNPIVLTIDLSVKELDSTRVTFDVVPTTVSLMPNGDEQNLSGTVTLDGNTVDLKDCTITWSSNKESVATVDGSGVVTSKDEGDATITATLTHVNGTKLDNAITEEIHVKVATKQIVKVELVSNTGTVYVDSEESVYTGTQLKITYDDNSTELIQVTVGMLTDSEGKAVSTETAGVYDKLTVTYNEHTFPEFILNVIEKPDMNFPEYPDEGSIDLEKYIADYSQFQNTGVAEVQLTTSGLPAMTGVDVILVTDLSNSMAWAVGGRTDASSHEATKVYDLQQSVGAFADTFLTPDETESVTDNTITLVTFGGYDADYTNKVYENYADPTQTLLVGSNSITTVKNTINGIRVLADDALNIGTSTTGYYLSFDGGTTYGENYGNTNYDHAFMQTSDAITALKKQYETKHGITYEESGRSIYVLFMTDGAPSNYDGVYYNYKTGDRADVDSTWVNSNGDEVKYTMGNNGSQYQAGPWYQYIAGGEYDANTGTIPGNPLYWADQVYNTPGVADIFNIGFDLDNGGFSSMTFTEDDDRPLAKVLEKLVTGQTLSVYSAEDSSGLSQIYAELAAEIKQAATNAYFVDQMGDSFDLQRASTVTKFKGTSEQTTVTLDPAPQITVSTYKIYTKEQIGTSVDGVTVTADMLGKTYGDAAVVERVKFNDDGTEAYSIVNNVESENIIDSNGVICAENFWYNTSASAVMIDTDKDGTTDYSLPSETFYWNIGTISNTKFVLSYYVYLTGSAEGDAEQGTYATNNYATLYYENWLGNDVEQDIDSPALAWESASVYYGFYLVDKDGNPVVNRATGATGSFYDAVKVTNKIFHEEVRLNDVTQVRNISVASTKVPDGYTVYDENAVYVITIDSNKTVSGWNITNGKSPDTTYVTDYKGTLATNITNSDDMDQTGVDYTATTVWFAVVWEPSTVPDVVVIDYGLPVDISVLENDMFGSAGALVGVGDIDDVPVESENSFTENESSDFKLSFNAADDADHDLSNGDLSTVNGEVRYTPNTMQMDTIDKFAYEARYTHPTSGAYEYYYGDVTVIPATTVYYEENFVKWENSTAASDAGYGIWTQVVDSGNSEEAKTYNATITETQDEDRPGEYTTGGIDANNVYGYDSAYTNYTKYSLGGAKKVTVDPATGSASTAPYAEFEFTGTGFDIVSLTDSDSGLILVTVTGTYAENGETKTKTIVKTVNNYYGYTYNSETGEWQVDKESTDTIWQVPVIKIEDLPYGQYTAKIQVAYIDAYDHVADGSYSFWLDAIRVYDPIKTETIVSGNTTVGDIYEEDYEATPDYMVLKKLLLSAGSLGVDTDSTDGVTVGAVFIDGKSETTEISDYANPGPNNETYLAYGQGVAFKLTAQQKPDSVQLGVKLAYGDSATVRLDSVTTTISGNQTTNVDTMEISTATDMYYEMPLTWVELKDGDGNVVGYETGMLVLSNSAKDSVLSITNLKYTGGVEIASDSSAEPLGLIVDEEVIVQAPMMMMRLYNPVVEDEGDNEEEVISETFVPKYLTSSWDKGNGKKKYVLTIMTSDDVDSVTVNGEKIKKYDHIPKGKSKDKNTSASKMRSWSYTVKISNSGTYGYEVVAYNAKGIASEVIMTELTVENHK